MKSKLSHNLKRLRKDKGWTQQALADRLGLTRPTLGAYEEGRSEPKLSVLIDMATCFDTTVDALVRGSDSEMFTSRAKGDTLGSLRYLSIPRMTTSASWWFLSKPRPDTCTDMAIQNGWPNFQRLVCP